MFYKGELIVKVLAHKKQGSGNNVIEDLIATSFKYYAPALVELADINLYDNLEE